MPKTAILLGATGLVGGYLLEFLLKDETYTSVKIFGRNSCNVSHDKIEEHLGDLFDLNTFEKDYTGHVVFCCIGTTKAKTPDKETYRKIDYGIPVNAAKLAKKNAVPMFQVISAMGANAQSSTFYNKVKGEMERDVLDEGIENTYILRPSLIGGDREENRLGERIAQFFMGLFSFLIPKQYKMIAPETIAKAMIRLAATGHDEQQISSDKIKEIATQ